VAKKKNITIKMGLDGWVMTYGDMMSLLLTFFVLIVSFSSMQETKFEQAANSLKEAFGVLSTPESIIEFNDPMVPKHNVKSESTDVLFEVRGFEKMVLDEGLDDQIEVEVTGDGVMFRINAPFLFEIGGATLKQKSETVLRRLAKFVQKFPYPMQVEGHTDSQPMKSTRFPSNWDLSAARAVSVARYFQGLGIAPERISATGRGEFHPIADNATAKGRAKNRRVEVFLKMDKQQKPATKPLPFAGTVQPQALIGGTQVPSAATGNTPVRPIINPVTGRLGARTGQKQP